MKGWRDPFAIWALASVLAFWGGAYAMGALFGGPECVNDYDPGPGYEAGCFGGTIQYNGMAGFLFLVGIAEAFALPVLLFDVLGVPTLREWVARSDRRRRQLFQLLD